MRIASLELPTYKIRFLGQCDPMDDPALLRQQIPSTNAKDTTLYRAHDYALDVSGHLSK